PPRRALRRGRLWRLSAGCEQQRTHGKGHEGHAIAHRHFAPPQNRAIVPFGPSTRHLKSRGSRAAEQLTAPPFAAWRALDGAARMAISSDGTVGQVTVRECLLWVVNQGQRVCRRCPEGAVDLAHDVALQAPDDLPSREPLGGSSSHVLLRALVAGEADHDDPPESVVGDAVSAAVEAVA